MRESGVRDLAWVTVSWVTVTVMMMTVMFIQSAHAIRKSGAKRIIVYYYAIY